jgi:hypothetical protein
MAFGVGMFGGDFYSGFRDRGDQLLGQRQKIAAAFNEFKASNPEATYAEFQQFVDSISGGDNYLRGVMPADTVLKQLSTDSEQRRRLRAEQEAYDRAKREDDIDTMYGKAVRDAWRNGMDPNAAAQDFAKSRGIEDPAHLLALTNRFSSIHSRDASAWEQEDLRQTQRDIADALATGTLNDPNQVDALVPEHLRGTATGKSITNGVRERITRQNDERKSALMREAVGFAKEIVDSTDWHKYTADQAAGEIENRMKQSGMLAGLPEGAAHGMLKFIGDSSRAEFMRLRAEKEAQKREGLFDFVRSMAPVLATQGTREGANKLLEQFVEAYAKDKGIPLPTAMQWAGDSATRGTVLALTNAVGDEQFSTAQAARLKSVDQRVATSIEANQKAVAALTATKGAAGVNPNFAAAASSLSAEGYYVDPARLTAAQQSALAGADPASIRTALVAQGVAMSPDTMRRATQSATSDLTRETPSNFVRGTLDNQARFYSDGVATISNIVASAKDPASAASKLDALRGQIQQAVAATKIGVEIRLENHSWAIQEGVALDPTSLQSVISHAEQTGEALLKKIEEAKAKLPVPKAPKPARQAIAPMTSPHL